MAGVVKGGWFGKSRTAHHVLRAAWGVSFVAKELVQVAGALEPKSLAGLQVAHAGSHSIPSAWRTSWGPMPSVVLISLSSSKEPAARLRVCSFGIKRSMAPSPAITAPRCRSSSSGVLAMSASAFAVPARMLASGVFPRLCSPAAKLTM